MVCTCAKCEHCGRVENEITEGAPCAAEHCGGTMANAGCCEDCGAITIEDELIGGSCSDCRKKVS
jgi:hypothetical protein